MRLDARISATARRAGSVALVGVTVAAAAGFARGLPDPGLMANLNNTCLQFSQDGGTIWGDVSVITLDGTFVPAPGGEYLQGDFLARNICEATASLQVYAGRWDVSAGASGTWRTDLGGVEGAPVTLTGPATEADWGVLVGQTAAPRNEQIPVRLFLGIPAGETMQSYSINPGWAFSLEETEQPAIPSPPSALTAHPQSPTTSDRVTVSGTAEPDSTVEVTVDGVVRCATTASPAGTFSCDVGTLTRGTHQLSARATNVAGTSDPAAVVPVTVRAPSAGWGSLGVLLGLGALGSLAADSLGSLSSPGNLDTGPGVTGLGSPGPGTAPSGGGSGAGSSPGGRSGSAGNVTSGGNSAATAAGTAPGTAPDTTGDQGSGQPASGADGSASGRSSGTGQLSGEALGIAPQPPGAGVGTAGPAPSGAAAGAPAGPTAADGTGAAARGAGLGGTGSLGSSGSLSSVDRLIHLGGPIITVGPA
ncbi:Ig-like domain-containing protein [Rhodococcus sp. IEGM 1408]|uniref:Ig-like domain-containing protein n=1 Tax=Rhodococcus sp. IEGM 1408 TaxID=3082220 RepID=UPI0029558C01|nr:Ig-like domain-containing protein [Rhodococcus sp. IEGM 1408]MDV8002475.1 Ig-like domain-containing protein [Rhodococcus sp. IEGM 1408]